MTIRRSDADALPLLVQAMQHASDRDPLAALEPLREARTLCLRGSAVPTIDEAIGAAEAGDSSLLWTRAQQATCLLTWAFPPDPMLLPIAPDWRGPDCTCGVPSRTGQRFCTSCGAALS